MALILALFFGFILLILIGSDEVKSSLKMSEYEQEYPPMKYQEEYLLSCEYYQSYIRDPKRLDPRAEALEQARIDIFNSGYRPTSVYASGMSSVDISDHNRLRNCFNLESRKEVREMVPELEPSLDFLLKCREADDWAFGLSCKLGEKKWDEYCEEIDKRYFFLLEKFKTEQEQLIGEHPYEMLRRVLINILYELKKLDDYKTMLCAEFIEKYSQEEYIDAVAKTAKKNIEKYYASTLDNF